jgi:hypothetical protein
MKGKFKENKELDRLREILCNLSSSRSVIPVGPKNKPMPRVEVIYKHKEK